MSLAYTYWQEPDGMWLGYMNDYPDYMTQGHTLVELQEMLRDVVSAVRDGALPDCSRKVGMLEFA